MSYMGVISYMLYVQHYFLHAFSSTSVAVLAGASLGTCSAAAAAG